MNYKQYFKSALKEQKSANMATVALIGGAAVGITLGVLFATKRGKLTQQKLVNLFNIITKRQLKLTAHQELMKVITDVRSHVKQNAEGLLGEPSAKQNLAEIKLANVTTNWKKVQEDQIFPNEPNRS